jgi:ABC-type uncharacterized transport system permease subunit
MTRKTKRIIKIRVATVLAYITYAIIMLAIAGLVYLALDFLGLMAWAMSGQTPEGFYLGEVTCKVLNNIIVK